MKKKKINNNKIFRIFIIYVPIISLFLGIGYAKMSYDLGVTGEISMSPQDSIAIVNVTPNENVENYNKTMLSTSLELNDSESSIPLSVTIQNLGSSKQIFDEVLYDTTEPEFYSNSNIVPTLSNITGNTTILEPFQSSGSSITFTTTFGYLDTSNISNNKLNGTINFHFTPMRLVSYIGCTNSLGNTTEYIRSKSYTTMNNEVYKSMVTLDTTNPPESITISNSTSTLIENTDYTYENGVITFLTALDSDVVVRAAAESKHYDLLVFDGTKDSVVNTDIYLYSEENVNKNFRITFTIDDYDSSYETSSNVRQQTIFNCKNEAIDNVWPGIMLRLSGGGTTHYEFGIRDSHITTQYKSYKLEKGIKVSIIREDGKIYVNWNSIKHSLAYTYADSIDTFDVPLIFGGIINSSGEYDRIFKGTLSDITVELYEGEMIEEIDGYKVSYTESRTDHSYELDGIIYFDGTNYIDTGLNLFSETNGNKDFDISFTLLELGSNTAQSTLLNAKNESDTSYPGIAYRYEKNKMYMTARWPGKTNVSNPDSTTALPRQVSISRRNGVIYYKVGDMEESTLIETPIESLTQPFNVNLTFGASTSSSGIPFRYFKGYVSDISVNLYD